MNTLIHADIFFFVTTIAVAFVSIFFIIVLIYVIKILRTVDGLSKTVHDEGTEIVKDVKEFRERVKSEGARWSHIASLFGLVRNVTKTATQKKRAAKHPKKVEVDISVEDASETNGEGN